VSTGAIFHGICRLEDARAANELRPEYVHFVFLPKSPQAVTVGEAEALRAVLRPSIATVGVFADASIGLIKLLFEAGTISVAQLEGEEDARYVEQLRREVPGIEVWRSAPLNGEHVAPAKKTAFERLMGLFGQATGQGRTKDVGKSGSPAEISGINKISADARESAWEVATSPESPATPEDRFNAARPSVALREEGFEPDDVTATEAPELLKADEQANPIAPEFVSPEPREDGYGLGSREVPAAPRHPNDKHSTQKHHAGETQEHALPQRMHHERFGKPLRGVPLKHRGQLAKRHV
jgi:phosphoribosylanthranilate isomerase